MMHTRQILLASLLLSCWLSSALATPLLPIVEPCHRTENPLAGGWAGPYDPDAATEQWTSNGTICVKTAPAGNASTYWSTLLPADMAISATFTDATTTGTNTYQQVVRLQQPSAVSNTVDGYKCVFQPQSALVDIRKITNGTDAATLAGPLAQVITSGDRVACSIHGSTITLWHDSGDGLAAVLSAEDTTYTGPGYVGMFISSSNLSVEAIGVGLSIETFDDAVFTLPTATYGIANEACDTASGTDVVLSTTDAWETILQAATPGVRYLLNAGTYTIAGTMLNPTNGTAGNPITIKPNNCAAVTIVGRTRPCNYHVLAGIEFTRVATSTQTTGAVDPDRGACTGTIIRNNKIHATSTTPLSFRFSAGANTPTNFVVQGNEIYVDAHATVRRAAIFIENVGRNNLFTGNKIYSVGTPVGLEDHVQLSINWGGSWIFTSNYFTGPSLENFVDIKAPGANEAVVTFASNYFDGPALGSTQGCLLIQNSNGGTFTYTAPFYGNFIVDCPGPAVLHHISTSETGVLTQSMLLMQYNIVFSSGTTANVLELNRNGATIDSNVFIGGVVEIGQGINPDPSNLTWQANIFYGTVFSGATGIDVCIDNTFFNTTGSLPSCLGSLTSDPFFVSPESNWHLRAGSPSIGSTSLGLNRGVYPFDVVSYGFPGIFLLAPPTQVGSIRGGGTLQGGTRQ